MYCPIRRLLQSISYASTPLHNAITDRRMSPLKSCVEWDIPFHFTRHYPLHPLHLRTGDDGWHIYIFVFQNTLHTSKAAFGNITRVPLYITLSLFNIGWTTRIKHRGTRVIFPNAALQMNRTETREHHWSSWL